MQTNSPFTLCYLVFDGFSNLVLASTIEPLRVACALSGAPLFTWQIATIDGAPVRSSSGLTLAADIALSELESTDALVLVAGYGAREVASSSALTDIQLAALKARSVVGIDMGSWLMAAAGLLEGRRATVHWQEADAFREEFLDVNFQSDRVVTDGDRVTAGGATSVSNMTLSMIRKRCGDALSFDVMNMFVYDAERQTGSESAMREQSIEQRVPQLSRAIAVMREHIADPLPLEDVATEAAVSVRTLERLFDRELSVSAGRYYRMIRLARAQGYVQETSMPASAIAAGTGFASTATLSRAYRAHFGRTIRHERTLRLKRSRLNSI